MKLKEMREQKGISQSELARLINRKPNFISEVESGKKSISIETLLKVIDVLDVSADELLGIKSKK